MELATKADEAKKLKGRVTTLKSNVQRLESLSKKPLQIVLKPSSESQTASVEQSFEVVAGKGADRAISAISRQDIGNKLTESDLSTVFINVSEDQKRSGSSCERPSIKFQNVF